MSVAQRLRDLADAVMGSWYQAKLFIEHSLPVSHDSLHVIAGVLLLLGLALVTARPVTSYLPIGLLTGVTLWNEAVDLWVERWPDPLQQYGEGAKDVVLTLLLPLVLMLAARLRPKLFRRR